jgi:hypothetical protein
MGIADFPTEIFKALRCLATDRVERRLRLSDTSLEKPPRDPPLVAATRSAITRQTSLYEEQDLPDTSASSTSRDHPVQRKGSEHSALRNPGLDHWLDKSSNHALALRARYDRRGLSGYSRRFRRRGKLYTSGMVKPIHLMKAGKDVLRFIGVILRLPMDLLMSLARGFHNAPILYGDETVRQPTQILDFQTGLIAAGKVCTTLCYSGP